MAIVALVFSSLLGAGAAMTGWLAYDLSPLSAFGVYLGTALSLGLLPMGAQMMACRVATQSRDAASA